MPELLNWKPIKATLRERRMETGHSGGVVPFRQNQESDEEQRLLARGNKGKRRMALVVRCSNVAFSGGE
ncbi:hypothetical protein DPMN_063113 [Dreissena polymorpha]|uniref:Uncharacterized protein n=1 Tax=Dreissena polymorpha TaxID=45954 RepID=A0A9D4CAN5_DREPO|nr:hypothetical protein DPMN_063113 [Dreissena polymorpha]